MMEACTGVREEAILIDMDEPEVLPATDAVAVALIAAIHSGDDESLSQILIERRELATVRILDRHGVTRTLLHVVADWPGYFPNGPRTVERLLAAGADPDAATTGGRQPETPLHWAASSDDLEVADALIAGGAAIDVPGGSIGTPVENAVGYGCWHVARLLRAQGAKVDALWVAAGLGLLPLVREHVEQTPPPDRHDIDHAFWQACHGGQLRVAAYLLEHGADIDTTPDHNHARPVEIAGAPDTRRGLLIEWLAKHARR
jgi:ankyrin repeat protein